METIILKIIICSGILLGCYYLFLAKERTFIFNRFFLIFALVFSYVIPFITIKTQEKAPTEKILFQKEEIQQTISYAPTATPQEGFDYTSLILPVYLLVSGFFLCKLLLSIYKIKKLKGSKMMYRDRAIKVLEDNTPPFSFMNTIYISKDYFKDGNIEDNIFLHEEIHVKQKHTIDVLLVEAFKIVLWVNPFIYFYKKAMITNHEFIADGEVIHKNKNIKNYQELILQEILKQQDLKLIHQFNFNNTKKRFIMMTSKNSRFVKTKKFLTIPAFTALTLIFAERAYANNTPEIENKNSTSLQITNNGIKGHSEAYREFIKIAEKYNKIIENKDFERFKKEVPREDQVKLADLFQKFNFEDLKETPVTVTYSTINREIPSQSQLNQFINPKYNIELDGKVVSNNELKKYKSSNFFSVYIVKVLPKNPDFGKYEYGVVLYTKSYAKEYNAQKNISVGFKVKQDEISNDLKRDTITPKTKVTAKLKEGKPASSNDNTVTDLAIPAPPSPAENLVQAEFPGGYNELRKQFANTFDSSALGKDVKGTMKADLYISIDENGKATNVKADGKTQNLNNEAVRALKNALADKTWKPATQNNKPIPTVFKLPITFNIQ
ncbi:M56 family metallopeptidase [Chryseobacterium gwangjuense]|uniref:M56 family metallopeptidase n=1 Tax=Chryseobacterium gwangjuense TaxID=1069980 RepID=UPI001E3934E4|nr:M56 family metallopeptidase [Chryseobacterium gwangjuense]MCE3075029.1 M56 family metallopeptidase [Chryseobacterium gwangjuense]